MHAHVDEIDSTLIIPAVARVAAGFVAETEPVEVLSDPTIESLTAALERARSRLGAIASSSRSRDQRPVVLQHARVRSLSEFERRARLWIVSWSDDQVRLMTTNPSNEGAGKMLSIGEECAGDKATYQVAEDLLRDVRGPPKTKR